MKKLTLLVLTLFVLNSFGQDKTNKAVLSKINKLERRVDSVKLNIDSVKLNKSSFYQLQKDIISIKNNNYDIKKTFDDEHDSLFVEFIKNWMTWLTTISFFLATYFGYKYFISEYKKKINIEVAKKVKKEVDLKVPIEVGELTDIKIKLLQREYEQIENHIRYRKDAKILIITEGTKTTPGFDNVMKLFKDADGNEIKILTINYLKDLKSHYEIFKKYELLIIENTVAKNWILDIRNNVNEIDSKIKKLNDENPPKVTEIKTLQNEKSKLIESLKNNNKYLVELADNICKKTVIIYFGLGRYPISDVKPEYQHMVTFANAPSQLYGNMLNMLKFQNELKRAR